MAETTVGVRIRAATEGLSDVANLIEEIKGLGVASDAAEAHAAALQKELARIANQQALVNNFKALKAEVVSTKDAMDAARAKATALGREIAQSGSPTDQMKAKFEAARAAVTSTEAAWQRSAVSLQALRNRMADAGVSTQNLAATQRQLSQDLRAVQSAEQALNTRLTETANSARAAANSLGQLGAKGRPALDSVRQGADATAASFQKMAQFAGAALSLGALVQTAKSVGATADAYNNLAARLKIATGSQQGMNEALDAVRATSNSTGTALESVASLYARLATSTKNLGLTQDEVSQLTDTITKGFAVSGATAQEASAAMIQLSQAFASGVLRGEELNSVLEQAPRLAQAIADGMGIARSELRKMGMEGKLASEQVLRAIQGQRATLEAEFGQLPQTIGRAVQSVSNEWTYFVGQLDDSTGASEKAAGALRSLSQNMDGIVGAAERLSLAIGTGLGLYAVNGLYNFIKAGNVLKNTTTSVLGALDKLPKTVSISLVTAGFVEALEIAANYGKELGGWLAKMSGNDVESANKRLEATFRGLASGAQETVSALQQYSSVSVLAADDVAKLTGESLKQYQAQLEGAQRYSQAVIELQQWNRQLGKEDAAATAAAQKKFAEIKKGYDEIGKAAKFTKEQLDALMTTNAKGLVADFDALKTAGKDTETAMKGLMKAFDPTNLGAVKDFGQALGEMFLTNRISAKEFEEAWQAALKGLDGQQLVVFQTVAAAAFGETKRDVASLGQIIDVSLRQALEGAGVDATKAFTGMSQKSQDAIANINVLMANFDKLKDKTSNVGTVLKDVFSNAIKTADTPAALEAIGQKLETVADKGAFAKKQIADLRKELGERIAEVTPGIQTLTEAFDKLGIQSQESLQKAASEAKTAYEAVRSLGGSIQDQRAAWEAYAAKAVAANNGVASTGLKAQASVLGLRKELDKIVGSTEGAQRAAESLQDGWEKAARVAERNTEAVRQHGTAMVAAAQQALENAKAQGDLLAIEEATVNVRNAEAKAAQDLAAALEAEAAAAWNNVAAMKEKAAADGDVSAAEQGVIDQAKKAAEALQQQADAAQNAAEKASAAATAATEKKEEVRTVSIDWGALAASYGVAAGKADELASAQAKVWAGMQRMYSTGFGGLDGYIDAINAATERAAGFVKAMSRVEEAAAGGDAALGDYVAALRRAIYMGSIMGNEEMAPLLAALRDAKERIRDLGDSARDTLNSLRDELDGMNKNYDEIERRRAEARRAEIEAQLAIAKSAGNTSAVRDLQQALGLLNQISQTRIREAAQRESEDRRNAALGTASGTGTAAAAAADRVVTKVVDLNITVGKETGTATVVEGSEEVIVDMLRKAQMVAS